MRPRTGVTPPPPPPPDNPSSRGSRAHAGGSVHLGSRPEGTRPASPRSDLSCTAGSVGAGASGCPSAIGLQTHGAVGAWEASGPSVD
eukprot:5017459-Prymnesium_polylepis.1